MREVFMLSFITVARTSAALFYAAAFGLMCIAAAPARQLSKPEAAEAEPPAALSERVSRLIEQMGDARFTVRQHAERELADIGAAAFDALSEAQNHRDLEIAHRARTLVQSIRMEWVRETDSEEVRKLLSDYDSQPDQERRIRIAKLAAKPQSEGLAPLCRLVRFERSVLLSKQAALVIMDQKRPPEPAWPERSHIILDETRLSKRPAVRWLRAYAEFPANPEQGLTAWNLLVEEESQLTKRSPAYEQRAIQAGLLRQQVMMLLTQTKQDEALGVMRAMLDLENPDPESLTRLIEWVIRHEAWPLIDEVAKRFDRQLNENPYLIYLIAQAHEVRGDAKKAEDMAARALAQQPSDVNRHFKLAVELQQQGLAKWAEREYKAVIDADKQGPYGDYACSVLAELLNDYERFGEAADLLEQVVNRMGDQPRARRAPSIIERSRTQIKGRMLFFRAKQYAADKEAAKQLEHLNKALELNPSDPDLLIALYRAEQPETERENVRKKVRQASALLRQKITAAPDEANAMNEYAWLVANTEGDFDEAIRLSERSVELTQSELRGGYLDTLAHCYAAKKDYVTALKHQARAMELEPHSQEIKRAYARFKRQQEAQAAAGKDEAGKDE